MRVHLDIDEADLADFLRRITANLSASTQTTPAIPDSSEVVASHAPSIIGRSRMEIFAAIKSGEIPSRTKGKRRLVLLSELKAWDKTHQRKRHYRGQR